MLGRLFCWRNKVEMRFSTRHSHKIAFHTIIYFGTIFLKPRYVFMRMGGFLFFEKWRGFVRSNQKTRIFVV